MKRKTNKKINLAERKSSLVRSYPFLRLTSRLKPATRKKAFKELSGDSEILKSFAEFAVNLKENRIPLKPKLKNQLKKHSGLLNQFAKLNTPKLIKKCCPKKAAKMVHQGGAIAPLIVSALASFLPSIISSLTSSSSSSAKESE